MRKKKMKNKLLLAAFAVLSAGAVLTGCGSGNKVEFQDPLVERCVRIELGKDADDVLTAKECASLKKLTIDCDLELTYINNWYTMTSTDCASYVDLCDMEYLTGLEELVIDNDVSRDMLVNLDALKKCTKLERLTMRYNPMEHHYYGTLPMGYKYLAQILQKMPKLSYLNLGYAVAEEHRQWLAGDNASLEFEMDHPQTAYYDRIANSGLVGMSATRLVETDDVTEYGAYWTYDFVGDEVRKEPYVLRVTSQEDLDKILEDLSKDTEDIHILYKGDQKEGSLDLEGIAEFAKLKTFSLYNPVTATLRTEDYVIEVENLGALADCKELYSVSLSGVQGSVADLGAVTGIRELGLSKCVVENPDFLEKLSELRELVVVYNKCEKMQEYLLENGSSFETLKYLRFEDGKGGMVSDYKGIEKYPNLESLSIAYTCGVTDVKYLAKCPKLSYLFFGTQETSLDIKELKNLIPLKYLEIDALGDLEELDGVEGVVGTRIISFYAPHSKDDVKDRSDWIEAALENKNLSCFIPHRTLTFELSLEEAYEMLDYKELYDAGVLSRAAETFMCVDPEKYPTMDEAMEGPKRD